MRRRCFGQGGRDGLSWEIFVLDDMIEGKEQHRPKIVGVEGNNIRIARSTR